MNRNGQCPCADNAVTACQAHYWYSKQLSDFHNLWLRLAVRERDLGRLEGVLDALNDNELETEMDEEVEEAKGLIGKMIPIHTISTSLQELKEIGSIMTLMETLPPHPIQLTVLRGVLLALGVAEEQLQDWQAIQTLVGSSDEELEAFVDAVLNVSRGSLTPRDVSKAQQLLARCNLNPLRVHSVCPLLTPFYLWVSVLFDVNSHIDRCIFPSGVEI
ncbi:hypothetical protein ACOMHN_028689 [Nucella lapillus]